MLHYGYLEDFIVGLLSKGRFAFSLEEVRSKYAQSDEAIKKALQRLKSKKEIASVRKEFYVIVPPEFRSTGIVPPSLFVTELMRFLNRDYYVGLWNAAAFYGAVCQKTNDFSIITTKPSLRGINSHTLMIEFYVKKEWSKEDVIQRKIETGYINVSSPELTALDLVFFFNEADSFNRITTVLGELCETINPKKLVETAERFYQITTVQRLGFLLDKVLQKHELSNPLSEYVKTSKHFPVLLRPQKGKPGSMVTGNIWKVAQNIEIESTL